MHTVILGAGGIGGYYGARLQAAGERVTFVARGGHLRALADHGLRVEHPDFAFHEPVRALALEALLREQPAAEVDFVLLCVKATATAELAPRLAPWLAGGSGLVVSLQNGVDNENLLAEALGIERVLGGLSRRLGGQVLAPGRISAQGPCDTLIGVWPEARGGDPVRAAAAERLAGAMNAAALPTELSTDIRRELWRKLLLNNGLNPLSAIVRLDTQRIARDPLLGPVVRAIMQETAAAAAADGVALTAADAAEMHELIRQFEGIKTSMLIDREHGRALELDAIPGAVLRRAEQLGLDAPCTRTVLAILQNLPAL